MKYTLSAPAKTFLLGEYLVLKGGPALLVNTSPRFQMEIQSFGEEGYCQGIHPHSPAGRWVRQERELFSQNQVSFKDPYEGKGGLGASSAQFLMVYLWQKMVQSPVLNWQKEVFDWKTLWQDYRSLHEDGQSDKSWMPSGADVVSQFMGKVCLLELPKKAQTFSWPFSDLGFFLLRTGNKQKTHEHLQHLEEDIRVSRLEQIFRQTERAWFSQNVEDFCAGVTEYGCTLDAMGLLLPESKEWGLQIQKLDGVKAVKGCGALGADTLVCFFETEKRESLKSLMPLPIIASDQDISEGVAFQSQFLNQEEGQGVS
ncbi:MAG: hypothetical protein D6797_01850 [Bdellovibrio sp.]|nr:MAG: hypothetical protein D6797_01850 [Bdellovibrio sp.]